MIAGYIYKLHNIPIEFKNALKTIKVRYNNNQEWHDKNIYKINWKN